MNQPNPTACIEPAGTYLVRPGFRAIRDAFRCHGISDEVRQELRSIVLVEVVVRSASGPLDLCDWHQAGLPYAPYDEVYFSLERDAVLARSFGAPAAADFALAFYLHFFDPVLPLETPHRLVSLPSPVWDRPPHLRALTYAYWD